MMFKTAVDGVPSAFQGREVFSATALVKPRLSATSPLVAPGVIGTVKDWLTCPLVKTSTLVWPV